MLFFGRFLSFIFLLSFSLSLNAQQIDASVSAVSLQNNTENWCWTINQTPDNTLLFGINHGVVFYDGSSEQLVRTPFTPMASLVDTSRNQIFISGYGNLGYLQKDNFDDYKYYGLEKRLKNNFNSIYLINDTVCFVSDSLILRYNAATQNKIDEFSINNGTFDAVYDLKNKLHFIFDYTPYSIDGSRIIENSGIDIPVDEYSYTFKLTENRIILGTLGNNIYRVGSRGFRAFSLSAAYFDNNVINNGARLNDSLIVLSSLGGGLAIVDLKRNSIIKVINFFSGLPDDEIRALFVDNYNAIWVSHEFGINRIDLNLGIENFSHYPGMEGTPLAVGYFNNKLHVATTDGVYRLAEVKNYNEVEVKVPINVAIEMPIIVPVQHFVPVDSLAIDPPSRSLFGFSRKNKKKEDKDSVNRYVTSTDTIYKKRFERRVKTITKRNLKSINKYYKSIGGLNGKFTRFIEFENNLLVGSNKGLYVVDNKELKPLIKDAYIYDAYLTDNKELAYFGTNDGLYRIKRVNKQWQVKHYANTTEVEIKSLAYERDSLWVMTYNSSLVRVRINNLEFSTIHRAHLTDDPGDMFLVRNTGDTTQILAGTNIYIYTKDGNLKLLNPLDLNYDIIANQTNNTWMRRNGSWNWQGVGKKPSEDLLQRLNYFNNIRYLHYLPEDKTIWMISDEGAIYRVDGSNQLRLNEFTTTVKEITTPKKRYKTQNKISLSNDENNLSLSIEAPNYYYQKSTKFSYRILPINTSWSTWENSSRINLGYFPPGSYTIQVRARNILGQNALSNNVYINIAKPFTQTIAFYFLTSLGVLLVSFVGFRLRLRKLNKDKTILERKVAARTATISSQKNKIEQQHEDITQSIEYAKNIQSAMLPNKGVVRKLLTDHFIYFKPRDIVSGDFYFLKQIEDKIIFIVADCTGHGVPGGFMSMLGISFLTEITGHKQQLDAAGILNNLRLKIKLTLRQSETNTKQKDGMDMAVCVFDTSREKLQFAGAFNPLVILRDNSLNFIKADRQPVAIYYNETNFTNHEVNIQDGDVFYMYTDGFADQLGGDNNKKYMTKRFKQLLLNIHKLPMKEQFLALDAEFNAWKGSHDQVDDVLVVGFSLNKNI